MAKRFTDTNKYRNQFFRNLSTINKLVWDYLYHDCDHAGIWVVDKDVANLCIDKTVEIDWDAALADFNKDEERIIVLENGKKWFSKAFVQFQYPQLAPSTKVQTSVIKRLETFGIDYQTLTLKKEEEVLKVVKKEEEVKEVVIFTELDQTRFYPVEYLRDSYLNSDKVLKAVSKNAEKSVSVIKLFLYEFTELLQSQSRFQETPAEYGRYYRNWVKKQEGKPKVKKKSTAGLDYTLLSTKEKFSLSAEDQVKLIKQRMSA